VTSASGNVSETNIKNWFDDIYQYLSDEKLADILNDPSRIFNGDETGFSLCPKTKSVLGPKGAKDIYEIAKGNEKENITAMFTFNAAGQMCNPMIIFKYQRIPQNIIDTIPANWGVGRSDTGWMKAEVFYEYIANIFYPFLVENSIQFPVILFVDGHKSHLTYQLSNLCSQLKIVLIALYPNATRILQPADVSAFRPLKYGWKKGLSEWRNQNPTSSVTKKDFAPILDKVLKNTVKSSVLINGFKACGLFPWNKNQIDYQKCLGKNYYSNENSATTSNTQHTESNTSNLNLKEFSDIIGIETLDKFNNIHNIVETENCSEEFFILHRVYEKLKKDNTFNNEVDFEVEKCNEDQSLYGICATRSSENSLSIENQLDKEIIDNSSPINLPETLVIPTENHVTLKKIEISPIESCLVWPVTPERKSTRVTERVPFVITSKNWKNLYEQKENKKRSIEEEKEVRKKTREENKLLKETKSKKTTKKKIVRSLFSDFSINNKLSETVTSQTNNLNTSIFNNSGNIDDTIDIVLAHELVDSPNHQSKINNSCILETGYCKSCNTEIKKSDLGIECNFCCDQYHQRCAKNDAFCDLSSDETLFICQICEKSVIVN